MLVRLASIGLRLFFLINIVLGILFWIGTVKVTPGIERVHIVVGVLFVICLWYLGVVQAVRGGPIWLNLLTFLLGLALAIVGIAQESIGLTTLIRIIHLALAILAVGSGEMAVARIRRGGARAAKAA
ncbi:MAG TPA: hypothetical protein VLJ14_07700 [Ktedonobacterales bacterium]|nr:hypothetical protein [Ktedonobacterales bacterium]